MTKVEFVKAFAEKAEISKKDAEKYVNAFQETIIDGLNSESLVQLTGFGSFKKKLMPERQGHNPQNPDEKITIPEGNRVTFAPGKQLKDAVNSKKKAAPKKTAKKVVKSKKKK